MDISDLVTILFLIWLRGFYIATCANRHIGKTNAKFVLNIINFCFAFKATSVSYDGRYGIALLIMLPCIATFIILLRSFDKEFNIERRTREIDLLVSFVTTIYDTLLGNDSTDSSGSDSSFGSSYTPFSGDDSDFDWDHYNRENLKFEFQEEERKAAEYDAWMDARQQEYNSWYQENGGAYNDFWDYHETWSNDY